MKVITTLSIKQTISERLKKAKIQPSKGLGQNFLISESAYSKIIEAGNIGPENIVLEIGPGLGTLTEKIAEKADKVIAIEKDRHLVKFLSKHFAKNYKIKIFEGDALTINPDELGVGNYKIIANIPYYITSRLLRTIFEKWPKPASVVFLIQKEVAQRIMAKPPHTNILALSVQYFANPKIISYISKESFYPKPKVDSAIIKLIPNDKITDSNQQTIKIFKTIKIGFSSKRKQLLNNLSAGFKISKDKVTEILAQSEIALKARPENLTLEQWQKLSNILFLE